MKKIAVFSSGSGSNAQNIVNYFETNNNFAVTCILSNNPNAFVLERLKNSPVETYVFTRNQFYNTNEVSEYLSKREIDLIVLAGFLWLVPQRFISLYRNKIINIHPSLLPKYGGKGMFGMRVHHAVVAAKETESGITIHYVNEKYDEGQIIFQSKCHVAPTETPEKLAEKIHELEYEHFPKIIEKILLGNV